MLPAVSKEFEAVLQEAKRRVLELPQVYFPIAQGIYEGMYHRTAFLPKGAVAVGAMIKVPTILIISGHVRFNEGEKIKDFNGYFVLEGRAFRRQIAYAEEDTYMTMLFPTKAKTVQEAEDEFTEESEQLQTRNKELTK